MGLLLASLFWQSSSLAYCRTTSCEALHDGADCHANDEGCATDGLSLFWPGGCVSFTEQATTPPGEPGPSEVATAAQQAFDRWTSVDCGQGPPSIRAQDLGLVDCGQHAFNRAAGNANIVLYQADRWPYPATSDVIALTSVTFNVHTGEIYDADIELNAVAKHFGQGTTEPGTYDLASVLTHEVGHFLGLSHTAREASVMFGEYRALDTPPFLSDDDVAGVCAIYPPERATSDDDCTPRNGLALACDAPEPAVDAQPIKDDTEPTRAAPEVASPQKAAGGCSTAPPARSQRPLLPLAAACVVVAARRTARARRRPARRRSSR